MYASKYLVVVFLYCTGEGAEGGYLWWTLLVSWRNIYTQGGLTSRKLWIDEPKRRVKFKYLCLQHFPICRYRWRPYV